MKKFNYLIIAIVTLLGIFTVCSCEKIEPSKIKKVKFDLTASTIDSNEHSVSMEGVKFILTTNRKTYTPIGGWQVKYTTEDGCYTQTIEIDIYDNYFLIGISPDNDKVIKYILQGSLQNSLDTIILYKDVFTFKN